MDSATTPASDVSLLETRIQALTELSNQIESLRQAPSLLLRGPSLLSIVPDDTSGPVQSEPASRLKGGLNRLKELTEKVRSKAVQEALVYARDSEKKDTTGLELKHTRHDTLKHCRPPSPESPQPYTSFQPTAALPFPTWDGIEPALKLEGLTEFIRDYNRSNKPRLHIWFPTASKRNGDVLNTPVIVRFIIRDVVAIYLTLDHLSNDTTLMVESATAFGPREKKPPHSQSDYSVYQKLSQQLAKIVQAQPKAPFQLIVRLLASYEDLFVKQCGVCERVLSPEGYVPPVSRVWAENAWEARHSTCLQK